MTNINPSFLKKALDNAFNHIILTDSEGIITYANKAAEKTTGYTIEEIVGSTPALWGKQMPKEFYQKFWKTIKDEKQPFHGEIKNKRKNGEIYYAITTVSPVTDEKGELLGYIGVEEDITRIKQLEQAKDEFLSIASHELRTPLAAIDGIVAMIRDGEYGPVSDEVKEGLVDVNNASERLIHLVNDLLSLSRIQAGRLKYVLTCFDVEKVVDEVVDLMQAIAKQQGLLIEKVDFHNQKIQADEDKVKQVLNNLVGNSLKFTKQGVIKISSKVQDDVLIIYITDTGIGIADDEKTKLFGKFQQVGTQDGRPPGTGLGLHLSREMVRKMGGDIWLEWSQLGKGSCFAFSLPLEGTVSAQKAREIIEKEAKAHPDQKSN